MGSAAAAAYIGVQSADNIVGGAIATACSAAADAEGVGRGGAHRAAPGQEAARYVGTLVGRFASSDPSREDVASVVRAIVELQHRGLFCEATFRHAMRPNGPTTNQGEGAPGSDPSLAPLLLWELSRAGVLVFADYVSMVEPSRILLLDREGGQILDHVAQAAKNEDGAWGEGCLGLLDGVRDCWRSRDEARAWGSLNRALAMTGGDPETWGDFWLSELDFFLSQEGGAGYVRRAFERIGREVLPAFSRADAFLRRALVAPLTPGQVDLIGLGIGCFAGKDDQRLQDCFHDLGGQAIQSGNTTLFKNIVVCNQRCFEIKTEPASKSRRFKAWLINYLQTQCKDLGPSEARVTQFILRTLSALVAEDAPENLLAHKEAVKMVDGLNETYVRDYCNLVQARLNDFQDGAGFKRMEAFRNQFKRR